MEEEQKVEEQPEVSEEVKEEEAAVEEEATEEAPAEEAAPETPAEEVPVEEAGEEASKSAEDMVRDLVNMVNVMKEEEVEGVTTKVQPEAADELVAKLEELAKKVAEICS
jgi:hypothetical protein